MTLVLALILDALLGEPRWLWSRMPHPAVAIGNVIAKASHWLNHAPGQTVKGIILVVGLVIGAGVLGAGFAQLGPLVEIILAAILLAQKSLVQHVQDVAQSLRQSLSAGRRSVAMIVGRDTAAMDETQVARGAIESAAENFLRWHRGPGILVRNRRPARLDHLQGYQHSRQYDRPQKRDLYQLWLGRSALR